MKRPSSFTTVNVTEAKKHIIEHFCLGEKMKNSPMKRIKRYLNYFVHCLKLYLCNLTNINRIYLFLYLIYLNSIQRLDTLSFIVLNCSWNTFVVVLEWPFFALFCCCHWMPSFESFWCCYVDALCSYAFVEFENIFSCDSRLVKSFVFTGTPFVNLNENIW